MSKRPLAVAWRGLFCVLALGSLFLLADFLFPFPWHALERSPARQIVDREGRLLRVFLPRDGRIRFPVNLDDLPEELVTHLLALEDRRFYRHPGIDPIAVARAAWMNLRAGRVVSGASTIPMQVARMCEPRERTLRSKLVESFRALQLEWHRSKREILETYLYLAPYGGNIEGIEAASRLYFGLPASRLSLAEAALLSVLPRAPNGYDPLRHPSSARMARASALELLADRGLISGQAAAEASLRPLPNRRRSLPFHAPHFARDVASAYPDSIYLRTTLDLDLQRIAERQIASRIAALRTEGIENVAVVVIENHDHAVRALVGSADFHEQKFSGQVNGALSERSPGSTLKPFLYALAFDEGMALPGSYLLDIPSDFGGYIAENYDGTYRGRVQSREALAQSLNAPAVRLLARVGVDDFLALLQRGGLATLRSDASRYGLPLVLGGGEVTLLDLTNLYVSLARHGRYRSSHQVRGEESTSEIHLLSSDSVHQVATILSRLERPDLPHAWQLAPESPSVSWKTGTSRGHRDAWSIGFTERFTIGVWVGSFSGKSHYGMSGSRDATPLLFDLFRALDPGGASAVDSHRLLRRVELCALSRQLPGPFCSQRVSEETAAGTLHLGTCKQHLRVQIDRHTGLRLAGDCIEGHSVQSTTFAIDAPRLAAFRRSQGMEVSELPAFDPTCSEIPGEKPPEILSPDASTPYLLQTGMPLRFQRIALEARPASGVQRLYWYQDGLLLAAGGPAEQLFTDPVKGRHRLVVVDDRGRSSWLDYSVE